MNQIKVTVTDFDLKRRLSSGYTQGAGWFSTQSFDNNRREQVSRKGGPKSSPLFYLPDAALDDTIHGRLGNMQGFCRFICR